MEGDRDGRRTGGEIETGKYESRMAGERERWKAGGMEGEKERSKAGEKGEWREGKREGRREG